MAHRVQVGAGLSNVELPDGTFRNGGTVVTLTDDQYNALASDVFTNGTLVDLGPVPDTGEAGAAPRTVNATTVLNAEDTLVEANLAAAANLTLPPGVPAGHRVAIRNLAASGANAATVLPQAGQQINGGANLVLASGNSADLEFDGVNWVSV